MAQDRVTVPAVRPLPALQDAHDQKGDVNLITDNKTRHYETLYIVRPNLDEEGVDRAVATIEEHIKQLGGNIEATEKKGRRRLAYEVNKMRDGYYVLTTFRMRPDAIANIKRTMQLSEDVIRSIIVQLDKEAEKALS